MLQKRISNLPLDLRRLLFTYFLILCRANGEMNIIRYICRDNSMRSFVHTKIDKRFWVKNNRIYYINSYTLRLETYFGIFVQIQGDNCTLFKEIIETHKIVDKFTCGIYIDSVCCVLESTNTDLIKIKTFIDFDFFYNPSTFESTDHFVFDVNDMTNALNYSSENILLSVQRNDIRVFSSVERKIKTFDNEHIHYDIDEIIFTKQISIGSTMFKVFCENMRSTLSSDRGIFVIYDDRIEMHSIGTDVIGNYQNFICPVSWVNSLDKIADIFHHVPIIKIYVGDIWMVAQIRSFQTSTFLITPINQFDN